MSEIKYLDYDGLLEFKNQLDATYQKIGESSGVTLSKTGTPSSSKTLTALDQSGNTISATFADIDIGISQVSGLLTTLDGKVAAVTGKGLSTEDFTTDLKNKLDNIASGATANTGTITGITMNGASKGTSGVVDLGTVITSHQDISGKADKSATVSTVSYDSTNKKLTKTINGETSNIVTVATLKTDMSLKKSDVGLGNVTNDSLVKRSEMGAANGVATLGSDGKVLSSLLPSYVDDIIEGYYYNNKFYKESSHTTEITAESGKIYVDLATDKTYRWSGSTYSQIKGDLVIGITSGTAADGGTANAHYSNTSNPHGVTKTQVGLGSVVNTGDSATPVSGGTTKFTTGGAYTELNKKVDKVNGKGLSTNDYTTDEKNKLSGIASGAQVNVIETVKVNGTALTPSSKAVNVTVPTKTSELTNNSNFVSDSSYVHTDNNYTTTEKNKLSGIASGAEVNQNAFSNVGVKVGNTTTTVAADSKTDTVTLIQGSNVTLTADTTNDTITIAAKDTTYSEATTSAAGLMSSSDKTKLNGIETGALTHKAPTTEEVKSALGTGNGTSKYLREDGTWQTPPDHTYTVNNGTFAIKGAGTQVASTSANASGNSSVDIVAGSNVTITPDATNNKITISSTDTNTWRPISDSVSSTDSSTSASSKAVKTAYDLAASKTSNTGTVTSVAVKMNGATKGTVTTSGTIDLGTVLTSHQDISGKADKTTTVNGHALSSNVTVTKSDVGLGNVTNDSQVKRSEMGAASGVATLDSNGKVPSSQLPSYVDDVIEGYFYNSKFYKESTHATEITGETGKIYVDLSTNKTYRWGGSAYAVISETLALGETSSTAYRGDRGKTAYTHSQTTSGNPHNVTKSDVGLGNVGNFKAVSTVASQGLTDTEKSNARINIGAGTSSFSGSYSDLSNKPTIPAAAANGTYTVKTLVGNTTTNVSDFTANQSSADDVTFVQGSNVTITPDATNRKITIAATDTKYTAATAAPGKVASASAQGSSTNYARQDHTHGIDLATGDSNGQVKIAGTNVSVKGLGSAAYTASSAYAASQQLASDANLNNIKTVGFYNAGGGNTITNKPSGVEHFGMEVIHYAAGNYYVQIVYNNSNSWRRRCDNNTWGSWVQDKLTDTTYSSKAAASGGSDVSLVTTGEKYTWNSKTSNTGTVTKVTAGTGLTGGDITTTGTIALATSGVTAGTYKRVTVDAYGRVTSGDNTDSDTKNTAGTTNKTGTKMFLAAATEQSANPVTYSNSNCYIGTDNCLYSGGNKVLTSYTNTTYAAGTGVTISGNNNAINVTYGSTTGTACEGNDNRLSDSRPASDVYSWAKASTKPSYGYGEISYSSATASVSGNVTINGATPLHFLTATGNISSIKFVTGVPEDKHSCHLIITATSDRTITLAHGSTVTINSTTYTFKCPEASDISLNLKANGYIELDLLRIETNIYVRGV